MEILMENFISGSTAKNQKYKNKGKGIGGLDGREDAEPEVLNYLTLFPVLFHPGNWKPFQCIESGTTSSSWQSCTKIGPVFGVWCCNVDTAALFLHAGRPLVGLHMVLDREIGHREW